MTTAERLDKFTEYWDPYGYRDSDMSLETAQYNLTNCPEVIVDYLLDIIEELEEAITGGKENV